jgi:hypothetical protein
MSVAELPQSVYLRTDVGGYIFDAMLSLQHESTLEITQHPVQSGAAVSDHAYLNPRKLTLQIGMSDAATSVLPGQFATGPTRSIAAYQLLLSLQQSRIPVEVTTRLQSYSNMLVQSITVPDDHTTAYGLKATVVLEELQVAVVRTVKISARPQVTDSTNKGDVEPQALSNDTMAKSLADKLGIPADQIMERILSGLSSVFGP